MGRPTGTSRSVGNFRFWLRIHRIIGKFEPLTPREPHMPMVAPLLSGHSQTMGPFDLNRKYVFYL